MSFLPLGYGDVALAALLIALDAGLSVALRLGLERRLSIAAVRMTVQLLLVGLVLEALFEAQSPLLTGGVALLMVAFAGHEISARQTRRFLGRRTFWLGSGSMLVAGLTVTLLALTTQVRPDPWYDPRYAIPLLGMILGNTMTGVALGLERLTSTAARERRAIEARLALGHPFTTAISTIRRDAARAGMIPIVNSMSAAGLVFLPGMMTGQILSGVDPTEAVKYQLLIMFLIAGGTGIGVTSAIAMGTRLLTDRRERLRLDRVSEA